MRKFKVRLVVQAEMYTIVTVEAQSSADAYSLAVATAKDGNASWEYNGAYSDTIEATGVVEEN